MAQRQSPDPAPEPHGLLISGMMMFGRTGKAQLCVPLIAIFRNRGESAVSSSSSGISIFLKIIIIILISLKYVNAAGRTGCLELTSVDVTSPLKPERGAGMGDAGRRRSRGDVMRRSAPLPR